MSEYILEMNHITKAFSGVKALDDVNLQGGAFHAAEPQVLKRQFMSILFVNYCQLSPFVDWKNVHAH